jgi:hypothetical protein
MIHSCGSERIEDISKLQASMLIDSVLKYINGRNPEQSR